MTKAEIHSDRVSNEKKLTLFLLCWLFGLFSLHRFYTGKYLSGGLQLSLLILVAAIVGFEVRNLWVVGYVAVGLLLLWWLVDFMLIIMGRFTDKEGKLITDWI